MSNSVLLCISTLLESGNHYSKMFELRDALGKKLFESISISLVCEECALTDNPERCTHKIAEMPRWLSSQKLETVKALLADDPVRSSRAPVCTFREPCPCACAHLPCVSVLCTSFHWETQADTQTP